LLKPSSTSLRVDWHWARLSARGAIEREMPNPPLEVWL
jgi:hypothetical protein